MQNSMKKELIVSWQAIVADNNNKRGVSWFNFGICAE